jgi:predicted nucleotidyltransferase
MGKGITLIDRHRPQLLQLCLWHLVAQVHLFGSAVTDRFDMQGDSDLDFLVTIDRSLTPLEQGEHLLQIWGEMEALFHRPVDLLTENSLHNPFLKRQIDATKLLLCDRKSPETHQTPCK